MGWIIRLYRNILYDISVFWLFGLEEGKELTMDNVHDFLYSRFLLKDFFI